MFILYIIHPAALNYLELRLNSTVILIYCLSIPTLPVIILGDFNINYIMLLQLLDNFDMNQHVVDPTHKQGKHIRPCDYTKPWQSYKILTVCDYNIFDHYSVECNVDLMVSQPKPRFAMKRALHNINIDDTSEIVCTFNTSLCSLLDKRAPLKRIRKSAHSSCNKEVESARLYSRVQEKLWRTLYTTTRHYVIKLVNRERLSSTRDNK